MADTPKLSKADAGRLGALARWEGERRIVRLADLDPRVRAAVLALIRADESARQGSTPTA